jgi:hypothetical protein
MDLQRSSPKHQIHFNIYKSRNQFGTTLTTPYTYLLHHKPTNKWYYGVRYKNGCDPKDFWVEYFTSSDLVHSLIDEYGEDSFEFEIRQTFNDLNKALLWEEKVLRRMQVLRYHSKWLNRNIGGRHFYSPIKTAEVRAKIGASNKIAQQGLKRSKEAINKVAAALRGRKRTFTPEWVANIQAAAAKRKGRKWTEEQKAKLRGRKVWNDGMIGLPGRHNKPHTSEAIEKIKAKRAIQKPRSEESRKRQSESMKKTLAMKKAL